MRYLAILTIAAMMALGCSSSTEKANNANNTAQPSENQTAQQQAANQNTNAEQGPAQKLQEAAASFDKVKDEIPQKVLDSANCVAVVPNMKKGALVVGGHWGEGVATCKTAKGWSAPAFFNIGGASIGAQIGGESTDLVMMVMNKEGAKNLINGKWELGAQGSVAAGPGREGSANVGWKASTLTYSSTKGLFVGASLKGSTVQVDDDAMQKEYNKNVSSDQALTGKVQPPADAQPFLQTVASAAGKKEKPSRGGM